MEIIAGDIGGTKSWLAWVSVKKGGEQQLRFERVYASKTFPDAESLLRRFMQDAGSPIAADGLSLALPGAISGQRVKLTNLDWMLDASSLGASLGIADVSFFNDFQAAAVGVSTLSELDYVVLNAHPVEAGAVQAITGAGTGLGLSWMLGDARGNTRIFATEAGHIDFAPANEQQSRLLDFLHRAFAHVSWERILSGPGINRVYRFCLQELTGGVPPGTEAIDAARVGALAQQGDKAAVAAMELFTDVYGAWVGNVALLYQPRGGLYIAGGVATHILSWVQSERFLRACFDKGRMSEQVRRTPLFLITNKRLGLQGAIQAATNRTSTRSDA